MRKRLTQAERSEETRQLLLDAAWKVFLRRGYHGATLEQVAAEAGYTKGAVYSQFEHKADLFLTLLGRRLDESIPELYAVAAAAESPQEAVRALTRLRLSRSRADLDWTLVVLEFRVHAAHDPALNARYAGVNARLRQAMADLITGLLRRLGLKQPMPDGDLARIVLALANGAHLERLVDGDAFSDEAFVEANIALFEYVARQTMHRTKSVRRPAVRRRRAHAARD